MSEREIFRRFWHWLKPHKKPLLISVLMVPLVAICSVAQPRILGLAVDQFMLAGDLDGLARAATWFLVVVVLEYILGATQIYLMMVAGTQAIGTLRKDVYAHVMSQGRQFFDRRPTGSLLSRTTTDVEAVGESIFQGVIGLVSDSCRLIGMVSYMLALDWKLTLVGFAGLPLVIGLVDFCRKQLRDLSGRIRVHVAELNGFMQEHLAGVEVVQLMGRESQAGQEFSAINKKALRNHHWSNFYDSALYAAMDGVSSICIGALVWFGGASVWAGHLSPGMLVAFVEYIQRAMVPIKEFSGRYATMQRSFAALQRIFKLLDIHEEVHQGTEQPESSQGRVEFKNVSFSYPQTDTRVLNNVSFAVEPGSVVALVGSTGSGKSTICRLLTRLYQDYEGSITVDGTEIGKLANRALTDVVSMVQQDVYLFRGSVAFNLSLGHPDVTHDRLQQATEVLQINKFVTGLPKGFESDVGERGNLLSAGQAQLLSFARAMSRDPAIVVLDEATASVDPATELLIQKAIARILELKTVVVVAHRLSTITAADLILVLEHGEVVERGTHGELVAMGGRYAKLYQSQLVETSSAHI